MNTNNEDKNDYSQCEVLENIHFVDIWLSLHWVYSIIQIHCLIVAILTQTWNGIKIIQKYYNFWVMCINI